MQKELAVIILAAGKGKRMKSDLPKVLHPLCGRPMLEYVLDLADSLRIKKKALVLGKNYELIKETINIKKNTEIIIQKQLLGTAHAVKMTQPFFKNFQGQLLILYGDHPLFTKGTIQKLVKQHLNNKADLTLLTSYLKNPSGYGRIIRDKQGCICAVLEEDKLSDFQKKIEEANLGAFCFNKEKLFSALKQIKNNNRQKEFYLTDVVELLYRRGAYIQAVVVADAEEARGINSYSDLIQANRIIQQRIHKRLIEKGVKILDPENTFIAYSAKIGQGSIIYPFTIIEKDVKIGKYCQVGPFAHLRELTVLEDNATIGNFLEVVRSRIGSYTKAKHFGYLGDAHLAENINIGAGTVTANFDGKEKHPTFIKKGAFIGSDTVLIAPVKIGAFASTGAGAVVCRGNNVKDREVVAGVPAKPLKKIHQK